jgi:transketolase
VGKGQQSLLFAEMAASMLSPLTIEPDAYLRAEGDRKAQAALNRINTLACILSAGRGWLGACFSCAEMLTALYSDPALMDPKRGDIVALGKGHAAAMQYACLAGAGILPVQELLRYELPDGPQAHTDIATPGIAMNTGSLGQTLSKAIGIALARPSSRIFVVLGDGELQEGQVWEAFMAWAKFKLSNLIVIVDVNGIQTDSNVSDIMPTLSPTAALPAAGINVVTVTDGNNPDVTHAALTQAASSGAPTLLAMHTDKGAGLGLTAARSVAPRSYGWHGGVPDTTQYLAALRELAMAVSDAQTKTDIEAYCQHVSESGLLVGAGTVPPAAAQSGTADVNAAASLSKPVMLAPMDISPDATANLSTGTMYGKVLVALDPRGVRVLDADLEKSCQLTPFALTHSKSFLEVGAAEQNMVGVAGGLALAGLLPFCNTYANFYRRAIEQVYVNASERTRVLYAGHYAGLCYATDGKTHQALGDVALFRGVPGMLVLYPCWPAEVLSILQWFVSCPPEAAQRPLYLRLHRTPALYPLPASPPSLFQLGHGVWLRDGNPLFAVLTAGPHLAGACLAAANTFDSRGPDVIVLSSMTDLAEPFVARLAQYKAIAVVEETHASGGLFDAVSSALHAHAAASLPSPSQPGHALPRLHHRAPRDFPFSTRVRTGLYDHFGLTPPQLAAWLAGLL